MGEHPSRARRRIVPDAAQMQLILGSLLGDARIEGEVGDRRLWISEATDRAGYVWWKYDRLAQLADEPPTSRDGVVSFSTIAHPIFDDVSGLPRERLAKLLTALGRSVRRTDELSNDALRLSEPGSPEPSDLIRE
jgi:hypothetical protein